MSALESINNELLENAAERHDNVTLVDWYSYSAGHDEWFDGDGTHLTPEGCQAYLDMLKDAIANKLFDGQSSSS